MAVAIKVDYRTYKRPQVVFALLGVSLLLLLAVFAFPVLNGTHRWIRFGQASLQPSEIAKIDTESRRSSVPQVHSAGDGGKSSQPMMIG